MKKKRKKSFSTFYLFYYSDILEMNKDNEKEQSAGFAVCNSFL